MSTSRALVEGRDWEYTQVIVPSSHAQFVNLDQPCAKPAGTEDGT
jgi:hypothetical protein